MTALDISYNVKKIVQIKLKVMAAIISQKEFMELGTGSEIRDINDNIWKAEMESFQPPGKYPHCFLWHPLNNELSDLFHDGVHIRYHDEDNKEINGAICGELDR